MDERSNRNRRLWQLAGGLAIAHVALMLGGFSLHRVAPLGASPSTVVADHVTWSMTKGFSGGYLVCLSFLVFVLFASLLARLMRGESELSHWLASTIAACAGIYVAVTLGSALPALGAALYDGHHGAPLSTVTTLDHVHWFGVFVATIVLGVFTLTVAAAIWVSRALPRWLAYCGVVAGVACLAGVAGANPDLVNDATLIWIVWFVALAIGALRAPRAPARVGYWPHDAAA
jgi:hypothetical protein